MSIYPILNFIKNKFNNNSIDVLEIGARYGESSEMILKTLNIKNYYIIDPYTSYSHYNSDGFDKIISSDKDDNIFKEVNKKLHKINKNVKFYRNFSNDIDVVNKFDDESLDLIFIDGNHTYKYVLEDLENYFPKLKKNGILCGDDFFMRLHENDILNSGSGYNEPMVYEAVIEFCKKYNKSISEFGKHRNYGKIYMIN